MIGISRVGTTVHVELPSRFDHRCVKEFQQLMTFPERTWVLDLSKVDYVDSAALGMLLVLRERVGPGGSIALRGAHGQARQVLLMTKFERMFDVQ